MATEWNPFTLSIDAAVLSGLVTPGFAIIERGGTPRNWDERMGYGWSGSFPVFTGQKLGFFDLTFRMFTKTDWELYRAIRPLLVRPPYGKRPQALDIVHPILLDLEIRSIVITDVKQLRQTDPGVWEKTIECLQFRKPKIALAKPEASAQKPESQDPYDKLIDKLSADNQALTDELAR
jgi:hypothetical protein